MPDAEPMSMLEGRLTSELDADLQCIVVRHATDAGEAKAFELCLAEFCGGGGAGSEGSCLPGSARGHLLVPAPVPHRPSSRRPSAPLYPARAVSPCDLELTPASTPAGLAPRAQHDHPAPQLAAAAPPHAPPTDKVPQVGLIPDPASLSRHHGFAAT